MAAAPGIKVAMTPERIARGEYIYVSVADCGGCHSQRDFSRVGGPEAPARRGRGVVLSDFMKGLPGRVVPPNLTPDRETGLGTWTDGEKIRAIREGVDKDGRALFPMMPHQAFRRFSDDDVEALVAFLDALPPVRNPLPPTRLDFPVSVLIKSVPKPVGWWRRWIDPTAGSSVSTWWRWAVAAIATRPSTPKTIRCPARRWPPVSYSIRPWARW